MTAVFRVTDVRAALPQWPDLEKPSAALLAYQHFYQLEQRSAQAVEWRMGLLQSGAYTLVGQCWLPVNPRATLVIVHGYYDHLGLYGHLIEWALAQGYAVLGVDLPGHGLSSGTAASIEDFSEYQQALQRLLEIATHWQLPPPWHFCGQSMGGAIVLDHRLHAVADPRFGELILLAPLVRPRGWWRGRLSYHLLRPWVSGIKRTFNANSQDQQFLSFVQQDPLQAQTLPVAWVGALEQWEARMQRATLNTCSPLIVQGDADRTVDWRYNLGFLQKKFAQPRILMIEQGRHHLVNEALAVREQYFRFLTQQLA
jgi:alpha-beta hydrolase superfamily lysophospholipase